MRGNVLLVDANNLGLRSYNLAELSYKGARTEVIFMALRQLIHYMRKFSPAEVVFVWDDGHDSRRLDLFPDYKKPRREIDEEKMKEYWKQRKQLKRVLFSLCIPQAYAQGREADDVIATLANRSEGVVVIVSTDRDYFQLLSDGVALFSPTKGKIYTEQVVVEEYGIAPSDYPLWKAIVGGHDGIPGLRGVGDRGARFIIKHLNSGAVPSDRYEERALARFNEEKEKIFLYRRLSEFLDVPMSEIKMSCNSYRSFKLWCSEAYAVLRQYGFNYYLERFAEFMSPFKDFFERKALLEALVNGKN